MHRCAPRASAGPSNSARSKGLCPKTAIIPGRSPFLFSNTALTSMEALTDHLNAKLWFPRAQAWIPLCRGPANHFFLRLFDFVPGGLIQDIPPVPNLARQDLDLEDNHATTCPALSGSVPEQAPESFSLCSGSELGMTIQNNS